VASTLSTDSNPCHQSLLSHFHWGNFGVGTEYDQAAMDVVQKFIANIFTQLRSIIKEVCEAFLLYSPSS
jgi:hypothetical protein